MSKILRLAYKKAQTLPNHRQDEIGEILLTIIEQNVSQVRLTPEQEDEVRRRLANPGPTVPEREMQAFFQKLVG